MQRKKVWWMFTVDFRTGETSGSSERGKKKGKGRKNELLMLLQLRKNLSGKKSWVCFPPFARSSTTCGICHLCIFTINMFAGYYFPCLSLSPRHKQLSVIWLNMSRPPSDTSPTLHPCNVNKFIRYSTGLLPAGEEKLKSFTWIKIRKPTVWKCSMTSDKSSPFLSIVSFSLLYYWITVGSTFMCSSFNVVTGQDVANISGLFTGWLFNSYKNIISCKLSKSLVCKILILHYKPLESWMSLNSFKVNCTYTVSHVSNIIYWTQVIQYDSFIKNIL